MSDDTDWAEGEEGRVVRLSVDAWRAMLAAEGIAIPDSADVDACLLRHPTTGQRYCVEMDRGSCISQRGRFVGGNCL